jgi:class 3 adenylate cyclase
MVNNFITHIPSDRRQAWVNREELPDRSEGAVLIADISDFTWLAGILAQTLNRKRGAEEMLRHINRVYEALISCLHSYQGSVVSFAGDAITCWFDNDLFSDGIGSSAVYRSVACAQAMQKAMSQVADIRLPGGATFSLAIKIAIAAGLTRRFLVGDPQIQVIDVLAGSVVNRAAIAGVAAQGNQVIISPEVYRSLGEILTARMLAPDFFLVEQLEVRSGNGSWPAVPAQKLPAEIAQSWMLHYIYAR